MCVCVNECFKVLCVIRRMKHQHGNNGIKAELMKEAIKWYLISSASNTKKLVHIFSSFLLFLVSVSVWSFQEDTAADWLTT